ncbi:MAG TPA: hypothetical protein PLC61_02630 [Chitinophagales bacterium]|nr:hypothetical protein [Chitinophagales bacterium]HMZ69427.1 hypothetical protein [Chitinophagales bacterium]HMZ94485.1 hypothetical protein [Chitinophagales bacterium]HNB38266.1 hypothetical protein [Chitinophagales bacterium]HND45283.1 hypothetical protein [Chitinophagales bacterium]
MKNRTNEFLMEENKTIQSILKEGYQLEFINYIKSGFGLYKASFFSYITFTLLAMMANEQVLRIPKFGGFLFFLLAPLQFGYFIFAEKVYKKQESNFKYFFDGYQRIVPIALLYFTNIAIFTFILILFFMPIANSQDIQDIKNFVIANPNLLNETKFPELPVISMKTRIVFFVMMMTFLYTAILLSLASYLLWFQQMPVIKSLVYSVLIVKKKFSRWILFASVLLMLNVLGLMAFGIGILITMPVSLLAFYVAYENVVGSETSFT